MAPEPTRGIVILLPTYNEVESLPGIVARIRAALPAADLAIIDDNSPDGTGALADRLAEADPRIRVVHRPGKQGLGAAYVAAYGWALEQGYRTLVQLDADGSHDPAAVPMLVDALYDADVAIGSRFIHGGRTLGWPRRRLALSTAGNVYAQLALGLGVRDGTGGFRAFRASAMRTIDPGTIESRGYSFQLEVARRAVRRGLRVVELPITFRERELGVSKLDPSVGTESLRLVTRWGLHDRGAQVRQIGQRLRGVVRH